VFVDAVVSSYGVVTPEDNKFPPPGVNPELVERCRLYVYPPAPPVEVPLVIRIAALVAYVNARLGAPRAAFVVMVTVLL
jgi:hypothetical protein